MHTGTRFCAGLTQAPPDSHALSSDTFSKPVNRRIRKQPFLASSPSLALHLPLLSISESCLLSPP